MRGRFTLDDLPVKNHYKHDDISRDFVVIADTFVNVQETSQQKLTVFGNHVDLIKSTLGISKKEDLF